MRRDILICLLLVGITLGVYWPVGRFDFIRFDDVGPKGYVVDNPNIQAGITVESVYWAFTTTHAGNWHPITWLSHMLDYQLFGLNAAGHHWMNLGFHIANTLLVFIVLREMLAFCGDGRWRLLEPPQPSANQTINDATGTAKAPPARIVWCSAMVAVLFAIHPLHIQSVAWVSERKDVLSAFFFLLTLWAYASYAQKKATLNSQLSTLNYILAVVFFALGLMSKPMLVTLPAILLLLDFWPLGRMTVVSRPLNPQPSTVQPSTLNPQLSTLLFEKLPFVALSLASSIVTLWAQGKGRTIVDLNLVPLDARLENVLVSYVAYLGKIFWPANLSVFYPYAEIHLWEVVGSALLLVGLSTICLWRIRSQPFLLVGWCWFVVMLLPVIGIVQVGLQSMADRYTYLPSIGLFLMVVWSMTCLESISKLWRAAIMVIGAVLLLACVLDTRYQLRYWKNSIALFSHSIEVARENNWMAYWVLGNSFLESGNLEAAAKSYQSSIQIAPDIEEPHYELGYVLLRQNRFEEAEAQYREALRLNPTNADTHACLGFALVNQRKYAESVTEYSNALTLRPNDQKIIQVLAFATRKAQSETALSNYYESLKLTTHARVACPDCRHFDDPREISRGGGTLSRRAATQARLGGRPEQSGLAPRHLPGSAGP